MVINIIVSYMTILMKNINGLFINFLTRRWDSEISSEPQNGKM